MSKQNKQRQKRLARAAAKGSSHKGVPGASGKPHLQLAPPWVKNGSRVPKAVRERQEKLAASQREAARKAVDAVFGVEAANVS